MDAETQQKEMRRVPLQRWGTVKEIADGTVYLLSDTGNFINGGVLVIDGGNWRSPSVPRSTAGLEYPEYLDESLYTRESKL